MTTSLSVLAGYISIACWLCAQLPQTITNYKLQSVDGLSITFLTNWFIGDGCNLIGCILTHQLPFQTILATYFVFIDATLLAQYIYYGGYRRSLIRKGGKAKGEADLEEAGIEDPLLPANDEDLMRSYASISTIAKGAHTPVVVSGARNVGRSRSRSLAHYQAVERIAANVRSAAEQMTERVVDGDAESDDDDDEVPSGMLASFLSERSVQTTHSAISARSENVGGGLKKSKRSKHVSWTRRSSSLPPGDAEGDKDEGEREDNGVAVTFHDPPSASPSRSRSRTQSTGRRSKTIARTGTGSIIFMAVWTLFGIRTYRDGFPPSLGVQTSSPNPPGRVLHAPTMVSIPIPSKPMPTSMHIPTMDQIIYKFTTQPPLPRPLLFVTTPNSSSSSTEDGPQPPPSDPPPNSGGGGNNHTKPGVDMERLIGRISAWICTTFYFTCRMPQIWKNFMRRSCQGLSPFLFLFAFLGNVFYVLSIATSPQASGPNAMAFFLESLPYLVGSGGVLTFDIIILFQVWLYRGRRPRSVLALVPKQRKKSSLIVNINSAAGSRSASRSIGGRRKVRLDLDGVHQTVGDGEGCSTRERGI